MKTRFGKALFAAAVALAMLSAAPECLADGDDARSSEEAILRLINSRSSGNPKAYAAAAERVASEAEDGKPLQQFVIALVSREQRPPPAARLSDEVRNRYLAQSRGKIRALAERRDNALAWYLLSLESNDMQLLKRAVDAQNVQALNAWGTIAIAKKLNDPNVNTNDLVRILYQSYSCFKTAADRHDANGLYNLGMCYMHGYGVQPDPFRALECFRAAAAEDHPEAINNIGGFYRDGIVVERDPIIAARWFAKSADFGNAYGELNYAYALQRGEGVAQDKERAARMFKSSAEQGTVEAMNAWGKCLYDGDGVEQDRDMAVRWYRVAAERGFPPAMENYAACFENASGGLLKDYKTATVWRMRARAARGDRNAAAWLLQNGHELR